MAGVWGDGQRAGVWGARVDPRLLQELNLRAAEERRRQAQTVARQEDGSLDDRLQAWWNWYNQPQQPLSREEIDNRGQELPFAQQVANLAPSQIPPREMPQSFDETLTGTIGDVVYGAPVIGPAALGLGARLGAAGQALQGKQGYSQALEDIQTKQEQFRRLNPGISGSAQAGGSSIFSPAFGSSMGAQVVGNAALGGLDAMVRGEDPAVAGVVAGGIAGAAHLPATFVGVMARTANHEMLALARKLKAAGASRDAIWQETGWDLNSVDKLPKFEISDEAARFVPPTKTQPHRLELAQQRFEEQTGEPRIRFATPKWRDASTEALHWVDANMERLRAEAPKAKLKDVLVHPELYAAHPELGEVETTLENFRGGGIKGSFSGRVGDADNPPLITYGGSEGIFAPEDNRSTLLHEGMHGVQDVEGFGRGANTTGLRPGTGAWEIYQERLKAIRTPMKRAEFEAPGGPADPQSLYTYEKYLKEHKSSLRKNAQMLDRAAQDYAVQEAYRRASGEVEARNVQKRMNMTAEERRATPPWKTQDVPDEQQIVRFRTGGGTQESREPKIFSPYSKLGQDIPVTETAPIYIPGSGPKLIEKTFDPMTLKKGDRIVGFVGDRSHIGEDLGGIRIGDKEVKFRKPVSSEGGAGYMSHEYNPQDAVWASNVGPTTTQANRLSAHLKNAEGDVYGATMAMAAPGIDFSVQATKTALETVRAQPLTKDAREAFYDAIDEAMAAPIGNGKNFPAIPDWPGVRKVIKDDRLLQRIPGKWRAKLMKRLDSDPLKKAGAPNMAAVRYAVTAPGQRNASVLESGHGWFKMGNEAKHLFPEEVIRGHKTYPDVTASPGGEYAGTQPMPVEVLFPGLARKVRRMSASGQQRTASMQDVYEVVTPRQLERFQRWLESEKGKQLGVAGAVAAGLLTAAQADALFGEDQTDRPKA